jgi:hypothetical protein
MISFLVWCIIKRWYRIFSQQYFFLEDLIHFSSDLFEQHPLPQRALGAPRQQPSAPTRDPCCNRQGSERTRPARQAPTHLPKGASSRSVFRRLQPRPKCERMPVVLARFRRLSVCSWARPLPRARRATQQQRERVVSCAAVRGGAARSGLWELTRVFGLQRQPVRHHERSYSEAVPHQRWLGR